MSQKPMAGLAGVPARVMQLYVAGATTWVCLSNAALAYALNTPHGHLQDADIAGRTDSLRAVKHSRCAAFSPL